MILNELIDRATTKNFAYVPLAKPSYLLIH